MARVIAYATAPAISDAPLHTGARVQIRVRGSFCRFSSVSVTNKHA